MSTSLPESGSVPSTYTIPGLPGRGAGLHSKPGNASRRRVTPVAASRYQRSSDPPRSEDSIKSPLRTQRGERAPALPISGRTWIPLPSSRETATRSAPETRTSSAMESASQSGRSASATPCGVTRSQTTPAVGRRAFPRCPHAAERRRARIPGGDGGREAPPDPKARRKYPDRRRREDPDRGSEGEPREARDRRAAECEGPPRGDLRADPGGGPPGQGREARRDRRRRKWSEVSQAYEENPTELDRWLRRCDEVQALLDCALRGCRTRSHPVVEEALRESMQCLELASEEVAGRVLGILDFCIAESAEGRFDEAAEVLTDLKESWTEAIASIRRD